MLSMKQAAKQFLAHNRIAVTGVSRNPRGHGGNVVFQRLRARGYQVYPVNPNAGEIEGQKCYPDLRSIPGGVDAVVVGTNARSALGSVQEAADLGIRMVWMHRSFGPGSVSSEAAAYGRNRGLLVIDGGCPLMFEPTSDVGHKCMRLFCALAGNMPREV